MAKNTGRTVLIIVSVVAIAGVVGYVLYRRRKAKKQASTSVPDFGFSTTPSGGSAAPPKYTFPFKTEAEGNRFRQWVNDKYPDYAKSIQLDRTGKLNSFVQKAWEKYGFEYQKTTGGLGGGSASRPS